jgi:diguanylate cyclase (GGDEF)-like protein
LGQIDNTLFYINMVLTAMWAFSWGVLGGGLKMAPKATLRFCAANLVFATTIAILVERTPEPSYLHYQGVEWLMYLGLTAFHSGVIYLVRLQALPSISRRFSPILLAVIISLQVAPDSSSYVTRSIVFSLTVFALMANCFWDCYRGLSHEQFSPAVRWSISGPFLLAATAMLVRAAMVYAVGQPNLKDAAGEFVVVPNFTAFLWMLTITVMAMNITMAGLTAGRLVNRFRNLAEQDYLTGCLNRATLERRLTVEAERSLQVEEPLACVFFDLDHFKTINDRFGHQIGDTALVHVVRVVQGALRKVDTLGRLGGEEFLVLLPGTHVTGAREAADRMRIALETTPLIVEGAPVTLTASFGVAVLGSGESTDSLLHRADVAMYQAKRNGRNRVEVAAEHRADTEGPRAAAHERRVITG